MATQKTPTREQRRARRSAKQKAPKLPFEYQELHRMLDAVKRDADSFFGMGRFSCRRRLSNGAVVRISITMPALPEEPHP